jgi:protease I
MSLQGKKVGILIESDYYEKEIFYYEHRFPEDGIELHFLSRLWGQPYLTFKGHEYQAPFECHESFENMDGRSSFPRRLCPIGCAIPRM